MAAAPIRRKRPFTAAAATRARRSGASIALSAGALAAIAALVGSPFAESHLFPAALGAASPSERAPLAHLAAPALTVAAPIVDEKPPAPVHAVATAGAAAPGASASVAAAVKPPPPAPRPVKVAATKRGPTIVEVLPAKPIIPPFRPKPAMSAPPALRPALPLDTELTESWASQGAPEPRHRVSAGPKPGVVPTSAERDG